MKKDLLTFLDLTGDEVYQLIDRACELKKGKQISKVLEGKVLGLIFEKASTRTRVSFEVAMFRLGGRALYLDQGATQIARGETYADTARVLSGYLDGIVFRAHSQGSLQELATHSTIPVINGLTDLFHPCQILADLMTIKEHQGDPKELKIAYVGDGNNMANSWIQASMLLGFHLNLGCPKGFWPDKDLVGKLSEHPYIKLTDNVVEAVSQSDVVNTDTWFSMGQKVEESKRKAFQSFQLNSQLLKKASPKAIVLHCLPAHRGEEITDEVIDGKQSVVFNQAENRLYVQMALLESLMRRKG